MRYYASTACFLSNVIHILVSLLWTQDQAFQISARQWSVYKAQMVRAFEHETIMMTWKEVQLWERKYLGAWIYLGKYPLIRGVHGNTPICRERNDHQMDEV
jgi:hypothetical protein